MHSCSHTGHSVFHGNRFFVQKWAAQQLENNATSILCSWKVCGGQMINAGNSSCGRTINLSETRENKIWRLHILETASLPNWKCSVHHVCKRYAGVRMISQFHSQYGLGQKSSLIQGHVHFPLPTAASTTTMIITQPICTGNVVCGKLFVCRCVTEVAILTM